jgi:Sugar (and other) transporter
MRSFQYPAYKQIDRRGRRFLLLLSLFGMSCSLLAEAFCFQISDAKPSLRIGFITFFVIVFTFFYAFGAGPVP